MLALTFSTGIVDAVGYLGLDRVFTGNMTGNVVVMGMGLTGVDGLPVLGPVLALCGFLVGAAGGGRALRGAAKGWTPRTSVLLIAVSVVLAGITVALLADRDPARPVGLTITTLLGIAMGVQAATARKVAVPDVSTVVVTSTITGLAADSRFGDGAGSHVSRRGSAVLLLVCGAICGALLLRADMAAALGVAALVVLTVSLYGRSVRPGRTSGDPVP